jgi:three-Cys-motif partner protein
VLLLEEGDLEQGRFDLDLCNTSVEAKPSPITDFFDEKKLPAVLKHGIVKRHLPKFAGKVGRTAPSGRVALLDTHAGAGYYSDGSPGSPAIAVTTADALRHREIRCLFVEKDAVRHGKLIDRFASNSHVWIAPQGTIEEHFDVVLHEIGDDPLFAFLDPYGFPPPFEMVKRLMQRSDHLNGRDVGPVTELLINFSVRAVQRTTALLDSPKPNPAQEKQLRHLTEMLGGSYWKELCRARPETERVELLLRSYMNDLQHLGPGWMVFAVPVAPAVRLEPIYYLIFATRNEHGVLSFSEACSLAVREYYAAANRVAADQLELNTFGREEWVPRLARNIESLLRNGDIRVLTNLPEIYADLFGLARSTHLRSAVKLLHEQGKTPSDGSGRIEEMWVRSPHSPSSPAPRQQQVARPIVSRLALAPPPSAFDLPTV